MNIFFTSDIHFFHKSVIDFERRPFDNTDEMNAVIIKRWNRTVAAKDTVYILGDVSFGTREETTKIIQKLNGNKCLVLGNHDKLNMAQKKLFGWVKHYYKLRVDKHRFILFHYPIFAWEGKEKGYYHLHGHVHTNSHHDVQVVNKINVGMDLWNYTPVSLQEILEFTGEVS